MPTTARGCIDIINNVKLAWNIPCKPFVAKWMSIGCDQKATSSVNGWSTWVWPSRNPASTFHAPPNNNNNITLSFINWSKIRKRDKLEWYPTEGVCQLYFRIRRTDTVQTSVVKLVVWPRRMASNTKVQILPTSPVWYALWCYWY